MPCWTIDELQVVGAYIKSKYDNNKLKVDFSPEGISTWYTRFGGIFRHVLSFSNDALLQTEIDQRNALYHTTLADAYAPFRNIEKTDDNKENVSHFVL